MADKEIFEKKSNKTKSSSPSKCKRKLVLSNTAECAPVFDFPSSIQDTYLIEQGVISASRPAWLSDLFGLDKKSGIYALYFLQNYIYDQSINNVLGSIAIK